MRAFGKSVLTHVRNRTLGKGAKNLASAVYKEIKHSDVHYFLNRERLLTKQYQDQFTPLGSERSQYSNYFLDSRMPLDASSVVYSFGILRDARFELELSKRTGCVVHLFDPTPVSIEYMKQFEGYERFKYRPVGLWKEDKVLTFFTAREGGSASAVLTADGQSFDAPCFTLATLMRHNGHDHIAVLKMDIEGAALPSMRQFFDNRIFPDQIVAEFERPAGNAQRAESFFAELDGLNRTAAENGYSIYLLPRTKHRYFSVELLYVRAPAKAPR